MSILDGIKKQLRSVIEWEEANKEVLFHKWTQNGDEIKNCSKLIVGPGQGVVFVYEGKVEAVHTEEGVYELDTANIPFWTTIIKFMQSFESEHKVGIYYFWRTNFLNQKWGTISPIKYNDPVYKFPVGLKCFGNFTFKIIEPKNFFQNIVGAVDSYHVEVIKRAIVDRLNQPLSDLFATSGFSYAEIDRNREELSAKFMEIARPEVEKIGFEISDFRIESTTFDEETKKRINRIADVNAEAQAAKAAGVDYEKLQQLDALKDAAKNEGGVAGMGVGMGAGVGFGQMMAGTMVAGQNAKGPDESKKNDDPSDKLNELKEMLDKELITKEEYEAKKKEILDNL